MSMTGLLIPDDPIDQGVDFALGEPIDGESSDMRPPDPWRREIGTERSEQQNAQSLNPVHRPVKSFQTSGIAPVYVLENHQHIIQF
jgi:hypothetical protein